MHVSKTDMDLGVNIDERLKPFRDSIIDMCIVRLLVCVLLCLFVCWLVCLLRHSKLVRVKAG